MADHPTASWDAMQDGKVFYRRQQVYNISNKLPKLDDFVVAGCKYGGPLALMRDTSKMVAIARGTAPVLSRSQIQLYSPAGESLLILSWDQGKVIKFGWTSDECLVVLNEEGVYRVYDLQGDYRQYSLGGEATELGVIDAHIHDNGLVAMIGNLTLLEVKGWEGGKPLTLANPGLHEPPNSWTIIPPDFTISRHVEVLLSVDSTIYVVDNLENIDQRISRGPFTHLAASPNGKSLALLSYSGLLWVVSTDFQRSLAEFNTKEVAGVDGPVRQIQWCANDAVIVSWDSLVLLVGPFGDILQYFYSGSTFVITELDGVRIIGPDVCDLIQKVPASTLSIFKPGSTSPSATLYDAWENFSKRSPKADESIRSIRPDLATAVDECIDAAGQEWEPKWQRRLLNAAKFGRSFLDSHNPSDFVNMGQALKVLNAVRAWDIGIPITYSQYNYTSSLHLVNRLTSRNLHLLALRISTYLSLKPDAVLKHWACVKITKSKPSAAGAARDAELQGDEEVCQSIVEKFSKLGGGSVSYADIAKKAWEVGRLDLATKLLDHEQHASDQVPLLLNMKEDRLALIKAADSGDTDLVYHVLLHLHKRLPLGNFFRLLEDGGEHLAPATRLLQVYAREQNREMLRDFYYSDDRRVESATLLLEEAAGMTDQSAKITAIKAAQKFFSEDKDHAFEAKVTPQFVLSDVAEQLTSAGEMVDENARLFTLQQQLEKDTGGRINFFGLSVNETIRTCLVNGMSKEADNVKGAFKVPDKRFWYIKLHALTSIRDFDGLDTFARSKRSPIGYEAFVKHLIEKGHLKEAATFVPRCDSNKRVDLYLDCGDWRAAGKECKERGDKIKMEQLRKNCPNSLIARELDQLAATMK